MRKLKDALRLKFEGGQSHQQIAHALGISKGVVTKYVDLAVAAALDWQAIAAMDEATLERRLLGSARSSDTYAQANYGRIHQELGRKGVTLMLLWEEYCAQVGDEHSADYCVKPWRYSQRSGSTNLNSEIGGNSGDNALTGMVRQTGVFHGQAEEEGRRCQAGTQAAHRRIQSASGTCRFARGQNNGAVVSGI